MRDNLGRRVFIPPYWADLVFGIFIVAMGIGGYYWCISQGINVFFEIRCVLSLGIMVVFKTCIHYAITIKGLGVCFLYIPIFTIKWDKISTAQYLYEWSRLSQGEKVKGQGIFITLRTCPVFIPEIDGLNMFLLRHLFKCFFIRFNSGQAKKYTRMFRERFPDLFFQVGCDASEFSGDSA